MTPSKQHKAWAMVCLAAVLPWSAFAQSATDTALWEPPAVDAQTTRAVLQRNIFLADRRSLDQAAQKANEPPVVKTEQPIVQQAAPPPPTDPDTLRILVGIAMIDGQPTAFIEDRAAGRIDRVTQTGPFAQGSIESIEMTFIAYAVEDEPTRTIYLRQNLTGENPTAGFANTTNTAASTRPSDGNTDSSTSAAPSDLSTADEGLSPLERMRLRRQQETQP